MLPIAAPSAPAVEAALPSVLPSTTLTPVPSPSLPGELPVDPDDVLPGELNDVINELDGSGTAKVLDPLPDLLDGGNPGSDGGGGGPGGGGGGGGGPDGGGGSDGGSGGGGSGGGGTESGTGSTGAGSSSGSGSSGAPGAEGAGELIGSPYATTAGRAAVAAVTRAVHLAGPFAVPLVLAMLAIALLIATGRGSDRLVKFERLTGIRRTYRL